MVAKSKHPERGLQLFNLASKARDSMSLDPIKLRRLRNRNWS